MFRRRWSSIGKTWCSLKHHSVTWPVHGRYACRTCGRRYPAFVEAPSGNWTTRSAFRPAATVIIAVALALFVGPLHAADKFERHASAEAEAVLHQFIAAGDTAPWTTESVEIHASSSKLEKTGQLTAIRRLQPARPSSYEVLQFAGDRTVEEQLISRYLNVDERASAKPAALVAITPANYKFAYKGAVDDGERLAYVFEISPRRNREGLIKGELWLDQRSGVPVHQSGRIVKSSLPSLRRISITRENTVRDGIVESRLTRITCEARHIGRAELVIQERPLPSQNAIPFASWTGDANE